MKTTQWVILVVLALLATTYAQETTCEYTKVVDLLYNQGRWFECEYCGYGSSERYHINYTVQSVASVTEGYEVKVGASNCNYSPLGRQFEGPVETYTDTEVHTNSLTLTTEKVFFNLQT
jgi:hypothetical protein